MKKREWLMSFSEKYHGEIHLVFGLLCGLLMAALVGGQLFYVLAVSILGAFLPDIDHIFYLFTYGRSTKYAREARAVLFSDGIEKFIEYAKENHKNNTGIISHNILVPVIFLLVTYYFLRTENILLATLFFSMAFHFIFDMAEDLLFFGKLNNNWWLRYNTPR